MNFAEPNMQYPTARFVAYTPMTRMEGPDGEAITAGSEVFVTYYKGLKVESITDGGRAHKAGAEVKTVRVQFDPTAVSLSEPIGANIAPNDPTLDILRQSYQDDMEVNVAIESARRYKTKNGGDPISPLTPIFHLMGADQPGGKANMSVAGNNTKRVIAAVNGQATTEIHSDPEQWAELVSNNAGKLSPEGFRILSDKEDWTKYSVLTPVGDRSANKGSNEVDVDALAEKLMEVMSNQQAPAQEYGRRAARPEEIGETRPFHRFTGHNGINLGHYEAMRWRSTWMEASKVLVTQHDKADEKMVWSFTDWLFAIADRAQVQAYGGTYEADREAASHNEAVKWALWITEHENPYREGDFKWVEEVAQAVTEKMVAIGERLAASVGRDTYLALGRNSRPQQNQRPQSNGNPDQGSQQGGGAQDERMATLQKALAFINSSWDDLASMRKAYKLLNERGIADAPVKITDQGLVFDTSGAPVVEVVKSRGGELSQGSQPQDQSQQVPQEQSQAPQSEQGDADQGQMDNDEFAAMFDAGSAEAPSENEDWGSRISQVKSSDEASALWSQAQGSLQEQVTFEGENMELRAAFEELNARMTKAGEFAEKVQGAESKDALRSLRQEAGEQGLLDYLVDDGESDEPQPLDQVIKNRYGASA